MVIGTFAYCGSGQDTLADSICKLHGYKKYSIGDYIRNIAENRNVSKTRINLRKIRREYDERYGRFYLPNELIHQIQNDNCKNVIITGMRTIEEYTLFKEAMNIKLIFVYADEDVRYKRMLKRHSEKDEFEIHLLQKQMEAEKNMFDYDKLEKRYDIFFDFNMVLEEYIKCEVEIIDSLLLRLAQSKKGEEK